MSGLWNFFAGLASILSFAFGFYYYWKSKKVNEVASIFYNAIRAESASVLNELNRINYEINNDKDLDLGVIKGKIETTCCFMASINHTVYLFEKTFESPKQCCFCLFLKNFFCANK